MDFGRFFRRRDVWNLERVIGEIHATPKDKELFKSEDLMSLEELNSGFYDLERIRRFIEATSLVRDLKKTEVIDDLRRLRIHIIEIKGAHHVHRYTVFYLNVTGYTSVRDVRILTPRDWKDNEQVIRYCEEQQEKARENKANPIRSAWKAAYPYAKNEQVSLNKVNLMLLYPNFRNVRISENPKNK